MRIFYICQRVPFPPDRGDKVTTFNEVRYLAGANEVHVFCLADGRADLENVNGLKEIVASVTAVPVNALRSKLRTFAALFGRTPLSVEAFNEPRLHAEIKARHAALKPDVMLTHSSNVGQYSAHFPDTPRIMHFADLDSLKWEQYAKRSAFPLSAIYALEHRRLLRYEREIARTFSHSLVITEAELRDFRRLIPDVPVGVVGNGVDVEYFRPGGATKKTGCMIFTGVMDYFPNIDAVQWFCAEILPLVQAEVANARLVICGSRPAASVRRLARLSGVTVTGRVPDTRPYLDAAEVSIAPLRMARGLQNKVLEALSMGLPVVSSVATWKGTCLGLGEGILAADDAREFAQHIIRLLKDAQYRADMGRKARASVEANYSWKAQLQRLDEVIAKVTAAPGVAGMKGARICMEDAG